MSDLIAVSKNGKFFGYADSTQIAKNPKLIPFDEAEAAMEVKKAEIAKVKAQAESDAIDEAIASGKGADPKAVKKSKGVFKAK